MAGRTLNTIIAPKCKVKGSLILEHSIEIRGEFEGNIRTQEDIIIREGGEVKMNLHAQHVVVEGKIQGNIEAGASVNIGPKGEVTGDIKSPNLKLEDGATTLGKIAINRVADKSKKPVQ